MAYRWIVERYNPRNLKLMDRLVFTLLLFIPTPLLSGHRYYKSLRGFSDIFQSDYKSHPTKAYPHPNNAPWLYNNYASQEMDSYR